MIELNYIVLMRLAAVLLYLIAFFFSLRIYSKSRRNKDLWILISVSFLILSLESLTNGLEWSRSFSEIMDVFGEYLIIIFFFNWIYVSSRFVSYLKKSFA